MRTAYLALAMGMHAGAAFAQIQSAPPLPFDTPQTMRNMEAVCTGAGADSRADPRWAAYPLKVEIAGAQGQYLGEAEVSVTMGEEAIITVRCGGPWVLLRIEPGSYRVTAETGGETVSAQVAVGANAQARVVLRFPRQGGGVSPEYVPK